MKSIVSSLAATALLAACNEAAVESPTAPAATARATSAATSAATGVSTTPGARATARSESDAGGAKAIDEETESYFFEYSWPAEAGRDPALAAELQARADTSRSELEAQAREAQADAAANDYPFRKHSLGMEWQKVADIPGFLSLSGEFYTYMGGAHGMSGMSSLIWDREAGRAIEGIDLFTSPQALGRALGSRICAGLNDARREKLGEVPAGAECPAIGEFTVLVGSSNGAYFDRLTLYAGPYVAGPYAEGSYEVDLAIDGKTRAAVKPRYRSAFAPPSQ